MPDNDKKEFQKQRPILPIGPYLLLMVLILVLFLVFWKDLGKQKEWLSDHDLQDALKKGTVAEAQIEPIEVGDATSGNVVLTLDEDGSRKICYYFASSVESFRKMMQEDYASVPVFTKPLEEESLLMTLLPYIIMMGAAMVIFLVFMTRATGGAGNAQMANFGKSRARAQGKNDPKITFKDVAGCQEEKEEMQEIVEFLSNPARFNALGASIPKGVLLVGPPGTGKTFLAKAVAGEAGVPFFSISGSDFVEMFVGVGASRVRDLFDTAKQHSPSIVFIDEIDAVGRRRGSGLGGGHDEREQTLNQLLVEMDGFASNQGVIVMAATNRMDILDPALLRPGRFDRQIVVNRPDLEARKEVLAIYAKNKPMGSDVDLDSIARLTVGFTPADLKNLMNEAAIRAGREKRPYITQSDIRASFVRVGVGTEKKSHTISEHEKKMTAYHEIGHAILHLVLPELDPVYMVSIIPTGAAGGFTMSIPQEDRMYVTKRELKAEMAGLLGGRMAEELVLQDVTSGASNDLERVSEIARSMVTRYGMSEKLGPLQFGEQNEEIFLGKEIGHSRNYGDTTADAIDAEVQAFVLEAEATARDILTQYMDGLHQGAALLMEREKISGSELEDLLKAIYAPQTLRDESQADGE